MDIKALTRAVHLLPMLMLAELLKISTASQEDDIPHASNEIFYHVGKALEFYCLDHPTAKTHVKWSLNGVPINNGSAHNEFRMSWDVLKKVKNGKSDFNNNEMVLIPKLRGPPTSTLVCQVKGRYSNNVVKVFNLVRDISRVPAGPVTGRHERRPQKCPLYQDKKQLTLSCEDAIKYEPIDQWFWQKDGINIPHEHTAKLVVTENGRYTCWYQSNRGEHRLLDFDVKGKKFKSKKWHGDWAFCKYSDLVTS